MDVALRPWKAHLSQESTGHFDRVEHQSEPMRAQENYQLTVQQPLSDVRACCQCTWRQGQLFPWPAELQTTRALAEALHHAHFTE